MTEDLPTDERMPSGPDRSSTWRYVRMVLVLAIIVALLLVAKPKRLWEAFRQARYVWLLAALPIGLAAAFLDAAKLFLLMRPHGFRGGLMSVFRTNLVVNFVSMFLPGTVGGGAVAWYRLSKPDNLRAQTFTALSLNVVMKLVVVSGLGMLGLALDARGHSEYGALMVPLAVVAALPLVGLCAMLWTGLCSWSKGVHVRHMGRLMPPRVHAGITKVFESMESYRSHGVSVSAALLAGAGRKLLENAMAVCALRAVGMDVTYERVLWIMCATEATSMIPITLSGWGIPQVTYVGLFRALGVSEDVSLASNILLWVAMLPVYLSGASILLRESMATKEVADHDA